MKILFLTTTLPDFPDDGLKIISHNTIKYLKLFFNYSIDVIVIGFEQDITNIKNIEPYCSSINIFPIKKQNLFKKIINTFRPAPNQVLRQYDKKICEKLDSFITQNKYDAIYALSPEMGRYIVKYKDVPLILNTIDAHSLREKGQYENTRIFSYKKYYSCLNYYKASYYERREYPKYDLCIVVSEYDLKYLNNKLRTKNLVWVPNGVDTIFYDPDKVETTNDELSLIFAGDYTYKPNENAAVFLYEKIFKKIKGRYPHLKLFLVGRNPTTPMIKLSSDKDVIVTGYVEDIRPYFKKATLFICPLRYGAGIKNKILTAMAMKKTVIASEASILGMEELADKGLLIVAKDEDDYIENIHRLFSDKTLLERYGETARDYVVKKFSWYSATGKLNDYICNLTKKGN
jgi:glycosyltransferase involved in cell wall biosynthesis